MRAEIISIGTEILMGEILDTNARFMAQRLPAMGIDLYYMHQIGDNKERLVDLIKTAKDRSDVVLLTGGLGPTEDDVTRDAIAESVGEEAYVVPELEAHLRNFFERRGGRMPEQNVKQATIIPSGESVPNPRGTAPGWWVDKDGAIIVAMPGPPAEMTGMWENDVAPRLLARSDGGVLISRTLKTTGLGESMLDELLGDLRHQPDPTVGVYHKADGVHVRLASKAVYEDIARNRIAPVEQQIRSMLSEAIWGVDEDTFQEAVGGLLKERGMTIAVMESCTGGLLASTITDVPGASSTSAADWSRTQPRRRFSTAWTPQPLKNMALSRTRPLPPWPAQSVDSSTPTSASESLASPDLSRMEVSRSEQSVWPSRRRSRATPRATPSPRPEQPSKRGR